MESYAKPRVSVPLTERKYFAPLALITMFIFPVGVRRHLE